MRLYNGRGVRQTGRLKTVGALGFIGIIGFLLGIAANFIYFEALPILTQIFPQILKINWLMWGIIGAFISIICCLIYAYLP
nr:hypothetical protein [Candidatus Njordarchaeum guaymaensis]